MTKKQMSDREWAALPAGDRELPNHMVYGSKVAQPVACEHKVHSVDPTTGNGHCLACFARGKMRFIVEQTATQQQPTSPDVRDALLFCLWHHQGGSSKIGQPIRYALGIGQHDYMNKEQLEAAKRVQLALINLPRQGQVAQDEFKPTEGEPCQVCGSTLCNGECMGD